MSALQQFIAQLAQFSTLETMQNLDQRLEAISGAQMLGEAAGLIGKSVEGATWVGRTEAEAEIVRSYQRLKDAEANGEVHH